MSKPIFKNNQIDIYNLLHLIWKGKWRLVLAISISVILFGSYINTKPKQISIASTSVKHADIEEFSKYLPINFYFQGNQPFDQFFSSQDDKIQFMTLTRGKLLNSFIDELEQGRVFEEGIRKFNLIDRSNYLNDKDYNFAIKRFVGNIRILPPQNQKGEKRGVPSRRLWLIESSITDKKKWLDVLSFVNQLANENIQKIYQAEIESLLATYEQIREKKIVDQKILINNLYEDDKVKSLNKITFLKEQAKMARVLGIAKNNFDTPRFLFKKFEDANNEKVIADLETLLPYYFKGYEAIEKELEMIMSRNDLQKKAFIKGLLSEEQNLRKLEQDKTQKYISSIYLSSPIYGKNFYAGKILSEATQFTDNNNTKFLIVISVLLGLVIGILYLIVRNELQFQKSYKK